MLGGALEEVMFLTSEKLEDLEVGVRLHVDGGSRVDTEHPMTSWSAVLEKVACDLIDKL